MFYFSSQCFGFSLFPDASSGEHLHSKCTFTCFIHHILTSTGNIILNEHLPILETPIAGSFHGHLIISISCFYLFGELVTRGRWKFTDVTLEWFNTLDLSCTDTSTRIVCSCRTRIEYWHTLAWSFFIFLLLKISYIFNWKLLINNQYVLIFKIFQQEKFISIELNLYYINEEV